MYQQFLKEINEFVFPEHEPEKSDIIFIPGNGYPQMAEHAARLYQEGYAPWILPSGKYSVILGKFDKVLVREERYSKNYRTEWEFLSDVLKMNGVPQEVILREDQATMTHQNALNSRKVTDDLGLNIKKAILCCKNYHAGRALQYYQMSYPDTEFYVCPSCVDGITRDNWNRSEEGIAKVLNEVTHSVKQFSLMMGL